MHVTRIVTMSRRIPLAHLFLRHSNKILSNKSIHLIGFQSPLILTVGNKLEDVSSKCQIKLIMI